MRIFCISCDMVSQLGNPLFQHIRISSWHISSNQDLILTYIFISGSHLDISSYQDLILTYIFISGSHLDISSYQDLILTYLHIRISSWHISSYQDLILTYLHIRISSWHISSYQNLILTYLHIRISFWHLHIRISSRHIFISGSHLDISSYQESHQEKANLWSECLSNVRRLTLIMQVANLRPIQNDAKNLKIFWNPGTWVLIWQFSATAIQSLPTWQGRYGIQKATFASLCFGLK